MEKSNVYQYYCYYSSVLQKGNELKASLWFLIKELHFPFWKAVT